MIYDEFRRQLGKAGLTCREFASLIGSHPNTITNYAGIGQVPDHLAIIAILMAEMADNGISFREAITRMQLTPKKPRGAARKGHFGGSPQADLLEGRGDANI